jgi:hypothetical protein
MGTLHTLRAAPPGMHAHRDRAPVSNAYFAIRIDAAVNLLEAREYQGLPRDERLARAHTEQRGFLNGFLDPALRAAFDLRIAVDPTAANPVSMALLGGERV